MDENNLSSLGLNFPPILVIKVMQVIAYMLTCIYCVTIGYRGFLKRVCK